MIAWLVHRADDLNHWTCPRKSQCWSRTLCIHDSELLVYEAGAWPHKPSWKSSRRLRRTMDETIKGLERTHGNR